MNTWQHMTDRVDWRDSAELAPRLCVLRPSFPDFVKLRFIYLVCTATRGQRSPGGGRTEASDASHSLNCRGGLKKKKKKRGLLSKRVRRRQTPNVFQLRRFGATLTFFGKTLFLPSAQKRHTKKKKKETDCGGDAAQL